MNPHPGSAPVLVAARRTPLATAGRGLAHLSADELAAPVLRALLADLRIPVEQDTAPHSVPNSVPSTAVADVILGNTMGPGGNVARVAALRAGLGPAVPGLTVDRQCGSGLEAVTLAAGQVRAGLGALYLAGGVESASTAPVRAWRPDTPGEAPRPYDRAPFAPPPYADPEMGAAADLVAREAGVSRERQDGYAARSHARAVAAAAAGRFAAEIVPLAGCDRDDRPRAGLDLSRLARLRPAFVPVGEGGTVTAGNSCGVNDGAAAVAVVSERLRAARGWAGLRLVDWACTGTDPGRPGLGPVSAVRALLDRQGLKLADVGAIEFVEAFAGQVLACADALDLDPERICADGGALALGHPWGASGAVVLVRLFSRMVRAGGPDLGLAAVAVGGGMGLAALVARVPGESAPDSVGSRS
ncbi:thiolase family protein [Actinopolymorpha singaporensis]|uniref:Acetyl-CoA C-acetyltransferase n=1 Tax=Actinopolymorpha singaporensis TaxID=117157 RepID=A0A1H1XK54_9ACTN|nr:thiolase family protein [Actinopolymorpha singaporensis]SDT09562.1 acetyl-CoA C-acetyltransferase [Actinopolymorpha singaporensis]